MAFIVRNPNGTPFILQDDFLSLEVEANEGGIDLEDIFEFQQLYFSSLGPSGALYLAITNGDLVRRNDADTADIPIANAFDDAVWRWNLTRQEKEALTGSWGFPSIVNRYMTETDPQLFFQNVVKVKLNPNTGAGEFGSIKDAVDSITTATSSNPWVVWVGPGVYTEPEITVPSWISIVGFSMEATIVVPDAPNHHVVTLGANANLCELSIQNAGVGFAGVNASNFAAGPESFAVLHKVSMLDCDTGIICDASTADSNVYLEYVDCTGGTYGLLITSSGGSAYVNAENFYIYGADAGGPGSNPDCGVRIHGTNSSFVCQAAGFVGNAGAGNGDAVCVGDGAQLDVKATSIQHWDNGVWVENTGAGPNINFLGVVFSNCTLDYNVEHPSTAGVLTGSADLDISFLDPGTIGSLAISLQEADGQFSVSGNLRMQQGDGVLTDISTLITEGSTMGVGEGGQLSYGGGFVVNIAAGFGYLEIEPEILHRYDWGNTSLTLPANSVRYIYLDMAGNLIANASRPNSFQSILLGRVITGASGVELIDQSPLDAEHTSNRYDDFHRDALGAIFAGGCLVSENGTRQLDVGSGIYYLSMNRFEPSGGTPINWTYYYRDGSGDWTKGAQNVIDNAFYDDGTGTLAALSLGAYTKHVLYVIGDGALERYLLVYGQAEYFALTIAEQANLATPPSYFEEGIVPIASIIVQEGVSNIVQIRDERPVIGFKASGIAAATDHGNLLGLLDDDHPQYLLVSGTRAMSGNLDMGGFSVTNVNLVDGVDVSAHASRHLPNGADPIATAAAVTLSATTTNTAGVANSLAHSDHTHAILTGTPSTQLPDQANATGTSANLARADHIHNIPADAPTTTLSPATTNAEGTGTAFARNDHTHAIATAVSGDLSTINAGDTAVGGSADNYARGDHQHPVATGVPSTITPDQANAEGTSTNLARADHIHNIPADAPTTTLSSTTGNTEGTAASFARSDHTHAIESAVGGDLSTINAGDTAVAGTATGFARGDHQHPVATGVPSTITPDLANAEGTSTNLARADHIHNIPADAPTTTLSPATTNAEGTGTSFARNDHTHAIATAVALDLSTINAGDAAVAGTSNTFARGDHQHPVATGAASTQTPDQANAEGTSTNLARADHVHNIPADAPTTTLRPSTTNAEGTGSSFARNDHTHAIGTAVTLDISTIQPDDAAAAGTADNYARGDHKHAIVTDAPTTNLSATTSNSEGIATSFSRSDHSHAISTGVPSTQTPDQANATGTSANLARADHIHNIPADAPTTTLSPATTNAEGTGTSFARNDHTHAIATAIGADLSTINAGDTAQAGVSDTFARGDHQHPVATAAPVTQNPDQANAEGTSSSLARADHVHNIPADAPTTTLSPNTTNAEGTGTSFARNDHTHAIATATVLDITTIQPDDAASAGTAVNYARGDHRHAIDAAAPTTNLSANTSNAEGTGTSFSRNDHSHAISTGVVSTQNVDQANSAGVSANLARADHVHNIPTAAPVSIGTANAQGSANTAAKSDHVHQGVHALRANAGANRYGDLSLQQGTNLTIADDGSGNFTINATNQVGTGLKIKSGTVTAATFTGNPRKATVTFSNAFASASYAITITGADNRNWTWESKAAGSFVINANSGTALTGNVDWIAIAIGESN